MQIVIIGGGFGGLRLARKLSNKPSVKVTLIDRFNYHQFQPLFYQVATSGIDASNISFPFRKVFHHNANVNFRMAEVTSLDTEKKIVHTDVADFYYDALVIATGAGTNFFGNAELEKHAYPMKSTTEALQIRHHLLSNFESIIYAKSLEERQRLLNVIVVGGGPTGVELSGAIADLKNDVLPKDYPEIDFSLMNIYLLEGSPALLGAMSDKSSADSKRYLEKLGVNVQLNTLVANYDGQTAITKEGVEIPTNTVIWAAGIKGNLPDGIAADKVVRGNRIKVNDMCAVEGLDDVYALGDIAYMDADAAWPNGHPQVAPVAIQMADLLANNLLFQAMKSGKKQLQKFEYKDSGSMATVGRNLAVVDVPKPKLHLNGFLAWLVWMSLHLMLILGVKNKLSVFFNWLYNYFTRDQNLRLIFRDYNSKA